MTIQYLDGKIEEDVPFEDIQPMETIQFDHPQESRPIQHAPALKAKSPIRNPISLKTYMKILASLEAR
jgi:hypothetical protein